MPEWVTQIADEAAIQEMHECFDRGPIVNDQGQRLFNEAEVARIGGLKIEIFSQEHPPPHFRVSYQGQTANYRIADCAQLNGGLTQFYRNVRKWHARNKALLINTWNHYRPTDCPVGNYRG